MSRYNASEKQKHQARVRQQRSRNKIRAIISAEKQNLSCCVCGESHPACLQYHHKDPETKRFTIANAISQKRPVVEIVAEISKCILLCANCHAKEHYRERDGHQFTE